MLVKKLPSHLLKIETKQVSTKFHIIGADNALIDVPHQRISLIFTKRSAYQIISLSFRLQSYQLRLTPTVQNLEENLNWGFSTKKNWAHPIPDEVPTNRLPILDDVSAVHQTWRNIYGFVIATTTQRQRRLLKISIKGLGQGGASIGQMRTISRGISIHIVRSSFNVK